MPRELKQKDKETKKKLRMRKIRTKICKPRRKKVSLAMKMVIKIYTNKSTKMRLNRIPKEDICKKLNKSQCPLRKKKKRSRKNMTKKIKNQIIMSFLMPSKKIIKIRSTLSSKMRKRNTKIGQMLDMLVKKSV